MWASPAHHWIHLSLVATVLIHFLITLEIIKDFEHEITRCPRNSRGQPAPFTETMCLLQIPPNTQIFVEWILRRYELLVSGSYTWLNDSIRNWTESQIKAEIMGKVSKLGMGEGVCHWFHSLSCSLGLSKLRNPGNHGSGPKTRPMASWLTYTNSSVNLSLVKHDSSVSL